MNKNYLKNDYINRLTEVNSTLQYNNLQHGPFCLVLQGTGQTVKDKKK